MWVIVFLIIWQAERIIPGLDNIGMNWMIISGLLTRGICLFLFIPALYEIAKHRLPPDGLIKWAIVGIPIFGITAVLSSVSYDQLEALVVLNSIVLAMIAACLGIWLSTEIQKPGHLLPLCLIAAGVDILSVAKGPTSVVIQKLDEHMQQVSAGIPHQPPLASYLILHYPQPGYGLDVMIGVGDLAVFALLAGAVAKFGFPRWNIPLLALWGFAATIYSMITKSGVPALPFIGIGFVAVNIRYFKLDRLEWIITGAFLLGIAIIGKVLGIWG